MRKWRAFLIVLFIVVVMFFLSFLLTITASRLMPPKRRPTKSKSLVLTRPEPGLTLAAFAAVPPPCAHSRSALRI